MKAIHQDIHDGLDNIIHKMINLNIQHLCGIENIEIGDDEALLLCVVKNGEYYIKEFLEYYTSLGIKHMIFLDNGSTDKTIDLLKQSSISTIYQIDLFFGNNNDMRMRDYLVEMFGKNKWTLVVDIDEFFDYPYSDKLGLKDVLKYLNSKNYNVLLTPMLDLFPKVILNTCFDFFNRHDHRFYNLKDLVKSDYSFEFEEPQKNIPQKKYFGGMRKTFFKINPILSKHALTKNDGKCERGRFGHLIKSGSLADFSGVLLHYKFNNLFFPYFKDACEKGYHFDNSYEYKAYSRIIGEMNSFVFINSDSLELRNINELLNNKFLFVSDDYKKINQLNQDKIIYKMKNKANNFSSGSVSVIIPWRNIGIDRLKNCFYSLVNQDYYPNLIKIILIDYGSNINVDNVIKICNEYNIEYLRVEANEWNRSHALNIGIKKSSSQYILISDIDIIFEKNYISECVRELNNNPSQVLYCEMLDYPNPGLLTFEEINDNYYKIKLKCIPRYIKWPDYPDVIYGGSIIFMLIEPIVAINGYDEYYRLYGYEDLDFIDRLKKIGLDMKKFNYKTSNIHQWHESYDGVKDNINFFQIVEANKIYYKTQKSLIRNLDGWGKINN